MDSLSTPQVCLRFERHYHVPHSSDERGWVTHRVVAFLQNENAGHLTISWIPDFDRRFRTLKEFQNTCGYSWSTELDMARIRDYHRQPYVAYVYVEKHLRRRGIGTSLYLEAARWVAEEWGEVLCQGDTNEMSQQVWESLKARGEPVIVMPAKKPRFALSYQTTQKEDV